MQVHFIDVGQGDSILIISPTGESGLIDGGEPGSGAVQYLQSLGINHLSWVLATHPHEDHIGGLVQVLQEFQVDEVITNGQTAKGTIYAHFQEAVRASKAMNSVVRRGDTIALGSLIFDVLNPLDITSPDPNNNSIVLRLDYGKVAFLFTGDIQAEAEANLVASGMDLKANVLKVAHHGNRTSSTPAFLAAVQPAVAIYSAALGNPFGYPHAEVLSNLAAAGAKVYGTDLNGTIIVTTDGNGYTIQATGQSQPRETAPAVTP